MKKTAKTSKPKAAKKPKMLVPPIRTAASKSIKSLKWKLKEERLPGTCIKVGCPKTGCTGVFCKKHKRILRKEQLRLNNIPWRKKVQKMGKAYKPNQMHVAYKGVATPATLKDEKRARKRVRLEKSVYTKKLLDKAIEAAKKERKQNPTAKPAYKKVGKGLKPKLHISKVLQAIDPTLKKIKITDHGKKKAKKVKEPRKATEDEFDFT